MQETETTSPGTDIFGFAFDDEDLVEDVQDTRERFELQKKIYKGHQDEEGWFLGNDPRLRPDSKRRIVYEKFAIEYHYMRGEYAASLDKVQVALQSDVNNTYPRELWDIAIRSAVKLNDIRLALTLVEKQRMTMPEDTFDEGAWDTFRMVYLSAQNYCYAAQAALLSLRRAHKKRLEPWIDLSRSIYLFVKHMEHNDNGGFDHASMPIETPFFSQANLLHLAILAAERAEGLLPYRTAADVDYAIKRHAKMLNDIQSMKQDIEKALSAEPSFPIDDLHTRIQEAFGSSEDYIPTMEILSVNDAKLILIEWHKYRLQASRSHPDEEVVRSVRDL